MNTALPSKAAGVYVHVPFCRRVCPYCDFAVEVDRAEAHEAYVDTLLREAELRAAEIPPADTLYFGGGTPSALSPKTLLRLIGGLQQRLSFAPDLAITLEVNPEDATKDRLQAWADQGITGLSFGTQSFDAEELRFLGRRHKPEEALAAVREALRLGFPWLSVDIIYGLPTETEESLRRRMAAVLALGTPHASAYQLTIEAGTHFAKRVAAGAFKPLDSDREADAFQTLHEGFADAGLCAYEVSNFARGPAFRSAHNQKYWRHLPYLGLGPGAHSFDGTMRRWNARERLRWQEAVKAGAGPEGFEALSPAELALEALMLGLRQVDGLEVARIDALLGGDFLRWNRALIDRFVAAGQLACDGRVLRPTRAGLSVAEGLASAFQLGG